MSKYVLIVDDDPDIRGLLIDALTMMGYESRKAVNGEEAIQIINQSPPGVIILDLMIPGLDGFSTLVRLRQDQDSRRIPVIVMSALVDSEYQMRALPGVIGVMPKGNFSIEQFRNLLTQAGMTRSTGALCPGPPS